MARERSGDNKPLPQPICGHIIKCILSYHSPGGTSIPILKSSSNITLFKSLLHLPGSNVLSVPNNFFSTPLETYVCVIFRRVRSVPDFSFCQHRPVIHLACSPVCLLVQQFRAEIHLLLRVTQRSTMIPSNIKNYVVVLCFIVEIESTLYNYG